MYPNPATDYLRLLLPTAATRLTVSVRDARGAAVTGFRYEGSGLLNVAGLATGLYTVLVSDGHKASPSASSSNEAA